MNTLILTIDDESLRIAADKIIGGEVVAFKTETVYGLGANAYDKEAVKKIFEAKGRPADNPLIVHVADAPMLLDVCEEISDKGKLIINRLMPGAITIVARKKNVIPDIVTAGLDTVAVRIPSSIEALRFIKSAGVPIAAPSANTSTRPSPTNAKRVYEDLNGKIGLILDGGGCEIGIESTVLDITVDPPAILRPGGVSQEDIESVIGKVNVSTHSGRVRSPGQKYKHYSPLVPLVLFQRGDTAAVIAWYRSNMVSGKKTAVLYSGVNNYPKDLISVSLGDSYSEAAHSLFEALRALENEYDEILIEGFTDEGVGAALNDRLKKASGIK